MTGERRYPEQTTLEDGSSRNVLIEKNQWDETETVREKVLKSEEEEERIIPTMEERKKNWIGRRLGKKKIP